MESPIPVTNPTDDHLINNLSLYLQPLFFTELILFYIDEIKHQV